MYKIEPTTRITKELLLSKYSQETYFEHYLNIPITKGIFCSPALIRSDKKPTCSFYKNKRGVLMYKDFAGPTFDFVGAVMYIYNCSYYKALKIIANDFGFIEDSSLEKHTTSVTYSGTVIKETTKAQIQVEFKDFTAKELAWWLSFGISKVTLKKFKVFSIKSVFLNGNYHSSSTDSSPIYGYFGGFDTDHNELWRLYMPTKRTYRFLSNWSSSLIQGAKQLPKEGNHCIITKSFKDVMILHEFGFVGISPTSENILIGESQFARILNKISNNTIVLFDNDLAGVKGAHKYKKKYGINCVFIKRKYSKDLSDLYKKVSSTVFWDIVDELNSILKDRRSTKHFYVF